MERIIVFDTTLRDGEQSPGCQMDADTKSIIARQLARLGVDVIEAGFPISSEGDFQAVERIAREVQGPTICALARTKKDDITAAARALEKAQKPPRIHTFVGTSAVHMEKKLRKSPQEILDMVVQSVVSARKYVDDVEFSPEDSARTGLDFLKEVVEVAIEAGATTINIPDTVGYGVGDEYSNIIFVVRQVITRKSPSVVISTHCHNDLGLAAANTLAGVKAGARQVECCITGIGERAGNAQLEAVVMALKTRTDYYGVEVGLNTQELGPTARLVSSVIGKPIPDNLPVVGGNAFAHGAGIHYDGVKKDRRTYEIMRPEEVGWQGESAPLVKHSGRHALRDRLKALGYEADDELLEEVYRRFTNLADAKTHVFNEDLHLLMQEILTEKHTTTERLIIVERVDYHRVFDRLSATVTLSQNGKNFEASGVGDGPASSIWDAITKALERMGLEETLSFPLKLRDFNVGKGPGGVEAVGLVTLWIESQDSRMAYGRGSDTDIVVAFAKAQVAAINHLLQAPIEVKED